MKKMTIKKGMTPVWVVLVSVLGAIVVGGGSYIYAGTVAEKNASELKAQIENLQEEKQQLEEEVQDLQKQADDLAANEAGEDESDSDNVADWRVYENEKYEFTLKVAKDWQGYEVYDWNEIYDETPAPAQDRYDVCLPTSSKTFSAEHPGYACLFKISVYPTSVYEQINNQSGDGLSEAAGEVLGRSDTDTFVVNYAQDSPDDIREKGLDKEVEQVVESFELSE